jgi:hypothetical protein
MAWPARTWVTAELVTATIMNAYLRDPIAQLQTKGIAFGIGDVHGDIIPTGPAQSGFVVPWTCNVIAWYIIGDAVGSIVVDILKSTFAAAPPTVSIAGTELPTLAAVIKQSDVVLSTWTPLLNQGDVIKPSVVSCSGIRQVTITLLASLA